MNGWKWKERIIIKILVVVDFQNDFVYGPLGTKEAQAIVSNVIRKIEDNFYDMIIWTKDIHHSNYFSTKEGLALPIEHCMYGTPGSEIVESVQYANPRTFYQEFFTKDTYGSYDLADYLYKNIDQVNDYIEFIGVCTDICVISNALMARSAIPEANIIVDASCCAGTTPEKHFAALEVMKSCNIEVINE